MRDEGGCETRRSRTRVVGGEVDGGGLKWVRVLGEVERIVVDVL